MSLELFVRILKEHNIAATEIQLNQFEKYAELLEEGNKVMNLTAVKSGEETEIRHFADSLSPLLFSDKYNGDLHNLISSASGNTFNDKVGQHKLRIIDIGTGAGFPGIPLAIMLPDHEFVLCDALQKRIRFLENAVEILDLKNVSLQCGRMEELARLPEYREQFDFAVSRAVADMRILVEYAVPFLTKNGVFIAYKSDKADSECENAFNAFNELGCSLEQIIEYTLPGSDFSGNLVFVKKTGLLSDRYPRRNGIPSKRPL